MVSEKHFDVLIVVTPSDCERALPLYPRLVENFEYGNICFIGAPKVGELAGSSSVADHASWIDENEILSFDEVHACMAKRLAPILNGESLPRGVTGWYYQQFLKMQYAYTCKDEYYMVWDGDTIPCRKINMFSPETGQPYLDLKHEHHKEYFDTMGKLLPGFRKVIERSFISEHMLFRCDIMKMLVEDIEKNHTIEGSKFWEKIINSIEPEKMADSCFSEFETYGTYVALRFPEVYKLREWHSFRLGGSFYEINTITDRDFKWLGVDFDAISFEKGQTVLDENRGYFDNSEVQKKISAKKLLQAAQMEYKDGYKEVWEDDVTVKNANVRSGSYGVSQGGINEKTLILVNKCDGEVDDCIESIKDVLNEGTYRIELVDGTAKSINDAVKKSANSDFGNADIFILSGATTLLFDSLYFLKQALYASDDTGAVGSLSNSADNKQKVEIFFDTKEEYIAYGAKINVPSANALLERTKLSSFALLVKRSVWDDIGGADEEASEYGAFDDAISLDILKSGHRLQLVRNSFVYSANVKNPDESHNVEEKCKYLVRKYGFDISSFIHASGEVISKIPFAATDRFAVLHYGCGLGAELKAIRSIFPNSELYGVETNDALFDVVRKTEKVFESLDEMMEFFSDQYFNVLIIDGNMLNCMADIEKDLIMSFLVTEPTVIIKDGATISQ